MTGRGWPHVDYRLYDEFTDTYGHQIRVQESGSAEKPHCRIFIRDSSSGAAHLNLEQAVRVRDALATFITEQEHL